MAGPFYTGEVDLPDGLCQVVRPQDMPCDFAADHMTIDTAQEVAHWVCGVVDS